MATKKTTNHSNPAHPNYGPERAQMVKRLGHMLRAAREEAGETTRSLAELAGIPQCTVLRYELGQREPRVYNLVRILKVLGMTDRITDFLEKSAASLPSKSVTRD